MEARMEVSLFAKVDPRPARDCDVGSFVHFNHTNLLGALTGDDGNAFYIVVDHNKQNNQVELLGVADGQLRTCNPDRVLHVVQVNLHRQKRPNTSNPVRLKDLKPGSTFHLLPVERIDEEGNDFVVSGSKKSLPDNTRAYRVGLWTHEDFDNDRYVIPNQRVFEVITS